MKAIDVLVVDSISGELDQIQDRIRILAYDKFLNRSSEERGGELLDWLDAERELLSILTAKVSDEEGQLIAEIEVPAIEAKDLRIQVAGQDVLINASVANSSQTAFGVIRLPGTIEPNTISAFYDKGVLKLKAPKSSAAKPLKHTAQSADSAA